MTDWRTPATRTKFMEMIDDAVVCRCEFILSSKSPSTFRKELGGGWTDRQTEFSVILQRYNAKVILNKSCLLPQEVDEDIYHRDIQKCLH